MPTAGVDFFRVDRSGPTRRLLVLGMVLVGIGASSIGAHLVRRLPESVSHVISLVGSVTMLIGLVMAFGALAMMLFENVYIAIERDRVVFHDNGKETSVPWDGIEGIEVDASTGFLVVKRADEEPLRWYAGRPASEIAAKVREAKRKAMHGLLKVGGSSNPPLSS
ncbi:MAG: hypothetical protein JST00_35990 [Deltaproteobacteria bacterium]|nr:hypothetical protein [Deltaproteobacteria bacterium]